MKERSSLPSAKRSLGQNFLTNLGIRDRIVEALDITPGEWVVELGPGPGVLTNPLTERAARVVAVELDAALANALPDKVARPEVLEVLCTDGVGLDYGAIHARAGCPLLVVGNLPFNAASALLRRALERPALLRRLVLMFQKEVAQRLTAGPGSRTYGLLTVVTAARARVTRLFNVSPGSFYPRPKVGAQVVRLEPVADPMAPRCLTLHDTLLRAVFAQRRKTLRNGLRRAPWPLEITRAVFAEVGVSLDLRAEAVSVEAYRRLAERLCETLGQQGGPHPNGSPEGATA